MPPRFTFASLHRSLSLLLAAAPALVGWAQAAEKPNFVIIYTDDHRWDMVGAARNLGVQTPHIDRLAERGMYFPNSFVTLSICSPSRAALLTGKYGSANGVMDQRSDLQAVENTLGQRLADAGYETSAFGKWHLSATPRELGFGYASFFYGLVPYWDVEYERQGEKRVIPGFVDDATTAETIHYLNEARRPDRPFFVYYNSFAPHMDSTYEWPARPESLAKYPPNRLPLTPTWNDPLNGKPPYLARSRPRLRALEYGYDDPKNILAHLQGYYASVTDMDTAVGTLLTYLDEHDLTDNTYILLMGDNGWFNGEHGFTSKVLAYEDSVRVPLIVAGPGVKPGVNEALAINVDLMPTLLDLAGVPADPALHGRSLAPLLRGEQPVDWRDYVYYEAPHSEHGTMPHLAIRTQSWKYIATYTDSTITDLWFEELYFLPDDPHERHNVVGDPRLVTQLDDLRAKLREARETYSADYAAPSS